MDDLILRNDNKIIFLILDGLGDIPDPAHSFITPLESAKKPNMDRLAVERGVLGRTIPVGDRRDAGQRSRPFEPFRL